MSRLNHLKINLIFRTVNCVSLAALRIKTFRNVLFFVLSFFVLVEESEKAVKDKPKGPLFESGVIVKITHTMPLPGRKCIKV